jgi:hypothetical protein
MSASRSVTARPACPSVATADFRSLCVRARRRCVLYWCPGASFHLARIDGIEGDRLDAGGDTPLRPVLLEAHHRPVAAHPLRPDGGIRHGPAEAKALPQHEASMRLEQRARGAEVAHHSRIAPEVHRRLDQVTRRTAPLDSDRLSLVSHADNLSAAKIGKQLSADTFFYTFRYRRLLWGGRADGRVR